MIRVQDIFCLVHMFYCTGVSKEWCFTIRLSLYWKIINSLEWWFIQRSGKGRRLIVFPWDRPSFIKAHRSSHDCLSTSHVLIACDDALCSEGVCLSQHCLGVLAMWILSLSRSLSFFSNQPTKYRRPSGARRSTTVRTIVVIIVLYHSSYPLEHPSSLTGVLFVCR